MQETVVILNELKKKKGLTLKQLSEKSGLSLGTVNKIMSGALQKIKTDKLEKLAKALDTTVETLTKNSEAESSRDNMGIVKIACVSPNLKVGDCFFNAEKIIESCKKAAGNGAQIALFPELCITGYTCGDLFFQSALISAAVDALNKIKNELKNVSAVVIVGLPLCDDFGRLYNVAAVVYGGEVLGIVPKINLPNYNEFFEKRLFAEFHGDNSSVRLFGKNVPFGSNLIFADDDCPCLRFAIEICEDIWVANSPSFSHAKAGANAVLNLSASNETITKSDYRRKMIEIQSAKGNIIYAYCSSGMNESTSATVFSAHNIICENGEILSESKPFASGYCEAAADFDYIENERAKIDRNNISREYDVIRFSMPVNKTARKYSPTPFVPQDKAELKKRCEHATDILSYGLKKRVEHTDSKKLVIGLSGGSDSTLAFLTCVKTLELLERTTSDIVAVSMPCFGTSKRTYGNSVKLAELFGATLKTVDITKSVTQHLQDIDHDIDRTDVTYENAQARERTQVLMDIANDCNGLVIGTGDMSELALGWATYNGDHMSMYGVNSSVPKTLVKALIAYYAELYKGEKAEVLLDVLDTPVSPELLPLNTEKETTQITEDVIGPYVLHDYFLFMLIRKGFKPSKVYEMAKISFRGVYDGETIYKWLRKFIWRFFSQQFKRACSPDGVKLGSVDLSKLHMRMPSDACCEVWLKDLEKAAPNA